MAWDTFTRHGWYGSTSIRYIKRCDEYFDFAYLLLPAFFLLGADCAALALARMPNHDLRDALGAAGV